MNLNTIKAAAERQLRDPKRREQAQKLVDTAKQKVAARRTKTAPPPVQDPEALR